LNCVSINFFNYILDSSFSQVDWSTI